MRIKLLMAAVLLSAAGHATAQISVGIYLQQYPDFQPVPGYPVYYAPYVDSNYFFYDGRYWIYQDDYWYESTWYNGPWDLVDPEFVPLYVLRVPVRYYRRPPVYFRSWRADAPPRWDQHWGRPWAERHRDWDRWDRRSVPQPAPLPIYQRQYSGPRYPDVRAQQELHERNYHYEPHDSVGRREPIERPAEPVQHAAQPHDQPRDQPHDRDAKPEDSKDRRDRDRTQRKDTKKGDDKKDEAPHDHDG